MSTPKELEIILNYAHLASSACFINATWIPGQKLLSASTAWAKRVANLAFLGLNSLFTFYGLWRLKSIYISKTQEFHMLLEMVYLVISVVEFAQICVIFGFAATNQSLVLLLNQLVRFNQSLGPSSNKRRERIFIFIQLLYMAAAGFCTLLFSAFEFYYMWRVGLNMLFIIFAVALYLVLVWGSAFVFGLEQVYVYLYFLIVRETLSSNPLLMSESTVDQLVKHYKSLVLLCNFFNQSYCRYIIPGLKLSLCAMFMMYMVVAIYSTSLPIVSFVFTIAACYAYILISSAAKMMTGFWEIGLKYKWRFRHQLSSRAEREYLRGYMKCVARSFQPLWFGVGGLYYMEKNAKLTLATFLVTGTADLLIAFK